MNIFINQTHIELHTQETQIDSSLYQQTIDLRQETLKYNLLSHNPHILYATQEQIAEIIQLIISDKLHITHLIFLVENLEEVKQFIKKDFKIIKAGGGLVRKENKFLMIYRLGKWDLPKGKMDDGENFKQTAQREVEEECNISIQLKEKIGTTWHFYLMGGKIPTLKQTKWYLMDCLNDSKMQPQIEEDIEQIEWMTINQVEEALQNSYPAIVYIFRKVWSNEVEA